MIFDTKEVFEFQVGDISIRNDSGMEDAVDENEDFPMEEGDEHTAANTIAYLYHLLKDRIVAARTGLKKVVENQWNRNLSLL